MVVFDKPGPRWGYRDNSLFDLAAVRANSSIVLRDHHRSHADIINFSNKHFYGGRLRVATDYRRLKRPDGSAMRWVNVTGNVVRPPSGGAVNQAEAIAVIEELRRIAITQGFKGEMGVVTPFRAQANLIKELVARDDTLAPELASRNFISETAHKFQGDERDLILFSPVVSRGTPIGATGFLKSQGNVFNVGITRARGALVVVGDFAACASSEVKFLSDIRPVCRGSRQSLGWRLRLRLGAEDCDSRLSGCCPTGIGIRLGEGVLRRACRRRHFARYRSSMSTSTFWILR